MGTPQHTFVPETGLPGQRRRKARLACNPCRARKTGCDGRKPVCSACSLRGWEDKCGYPDSVMQPSAALTLVDLDRRLHKLESETRAEPDVPHSTVSDASPSTAASSAPALPMGHEGDPDLDAYATHQPISEAHSSFLRQGLDAAGPRQSYRDPTAGSESPMSPLDSPTVPDLVGLSVRALDQPLAEIDPHALLLPPWALAGDLLRFYWHNFHSIFPFLHWSMFQAKAISLWKQKVPPAQEFDDLLFYAMLNMVFALACLRNEGIPVNQRCYHADEFYKRSMRLIPAETLDMGSLAIVQMLLLRTMYLYFAGKADRCWLMSGAAIRVAIGLGLQAPPKKELNQLEREMRRRVWYGGCVPLDQILANTFGRPGMIFPGLTQIPPPLGIDEEYLSTTGEGRQPEGVPSRMDMILYSTKVLKILDEMRTAARAPRLKINSPGDDFTVPDPSALLHVNSQIDDMLEGLPPHLRQGADYSRWSLTEDAIKYFQTQSQAIRFRLMLLRVLLLRPSLLAEAQRWATRNAGVSQTASVALQERFHREICMLCLSTVQSMVGEIHRNLTISAGISTWYALHFTFAAATILLVATLSPNLGVRLDVEPARSTWDRAMEILEAHRAYMPSAARGIEFLHRYRETISTHTAMPPQIPISTQGMPNMPAPPTAYPQQALPGPHPGQQLQVVGQPYGQHQPWEQQAQAMPTPPPMAEANMMEVLDEFLASDSLNEAWLTTQDFGQGNWMLHY
ncbi:activator of stress genes 1 [Staphylotrichum tortipilum]|uniref:Activator of stress genes 1 n=1 Tax=Staphylotrichum tortipilum TaxID=2831512 RepID=A0AAN6RQP1_9PEZI|nr:activator of stress genes 1 [Staphylotrichum longicolle]